MNNVKAYDCIIIGGGPGGLMAAIYLARFRCDIIIIDNNDSRAALIPKSHNYPGAIEGIAGKDILQNLRQQLENYHDQLIDDEVFNLCKKSDCFTVETKNTKLYAKNIILATGVLDVEPALPKLESAIKKGLIRHCLICDGYEVINKKIAIIGPIDKVIKEAILLKTYTSDITLFPTSQVDLSDEIMCVIEKEKIKIIKEPITEVVIEQGRIVALKTGNQSYEFDSIYSALGCKPRTDLAIKLGAEHTEENLLLVNEHQETSVCHLYAVGDIVVGLNQMCVAMAHAAIAAVAIFNSIKETKTLPDK